MDNEESDVVPRADESLEVCVLSGLKSVVSNVIGYIGDVQEKLVDEPEQVE